MKVLVLNCGSSSLKYQLFDMTNESVLAKGLVEKIGLEDSEMAHYKGEEGLVFKENIPLPTHKEAIVAVIEKLISAEYGVISSLNEIGAVGHRVLHGGQKFSASVLVDDKVEEAIAEYIPFGPLHNPANLMGIRACAVAMPGIPQVAVFDTAFHQTMPASSYIYALPYELYEKYGIRRFGFHGTSHRYVTARALALLGGLAEGKKFVTCHLGNGSSLAAIKDGKVLDTSMGFTPLEGMVMGTRSGDIDPAIVPIIMEKENINTQEASNYLNKKSGLLGVSGVSSDMRYVEQAAAEGNKRAQLALDLLYKRIIKYIGAYAAEMGGLDAIVFTAGIGENSISLRKIICQALGCFGLEFDEEANNVRGIEREITKPGSKVKAFIIPTNEELMIAKDTLAIVNG